MQAGGDVSGREIEMEIRCRTGKLDIGAELARGKWEITNDSPTLKMTVEQTKRWWQFWRRPVLAELAPGETKEVVL